ncbi:MAG TPA: glycine--tRNA ligase subunit beta [Terriglobales bacterium]|nr:glycine--tRNA ligase subunit beta [Terriglobales bacterium]
MADFLLEIGCEEIPARMIDGARRELEQRVSSLMLREALVSTGAENGLAVQAFSTPRRLAVLVPGVLLTQPDVEEQLTGPAVKAAFKDGQPTVAAQKFAEKAGVGVDRLERASTPKGEYLTAKVLKKGRPAQQILSEAIPKEIAGLYWGKSMYWRPGRTSERFVRPVRWLLAMLDGAELPLEFAGVEAGRETRGHRTLGKTALLSTAHEYRQQLREAGVVASAEEREQLIRKALDAKTRTVAGARWREDAALLNKVMNLTEWPSVILGNFEREYLSLPEEVLVTVMRDHQNYFAVEDANGKLAPHFLAVMNTDGDPQGIVQHGHERVLRARFNDARFFWNTDQKIPLRERVETLKVVTFQKDLGSYYEKAGRVAKLANWLSGEIESQGIAVDRAVVGEAAWLAKTDLTAELVKEFTELQGIIGGLYARHQGLGEKTGDAIYDHYKPESMEDEVPRTIEGAVLSIADKADSIAGMFALGLIPSGSKDPFALRRQANGIVKTVAEKKLAIRFDGLFQQARLAYTGSEAEMKFAKGADPAGEISNFLRERVEFYLRETRGIAYDVVKAVLAAGDTDVVNALARAEALAKVRDSEEFASIAVAFKRIKNILRQAREGKMQVAEKVTSSILQEDAERALYEKMEASAPKVKALAEKREYAAALAEIAAMRPAVDTFFDKVMVMVDDEALRACRLGLQQRLLNDFSTIADFSEIVTEKK